LYVDDSGTKEYSDDPDQYSITGNSPIFVFGGVLLDIAESGRMVEAIIDAKRDVFGVADVEIKSNWLRIPKEREARYIQPYGVSEKRIAEFVSKYYDIINEADLAIVAAVVNKRQVQSEYPTPWYAPAIAYDVLLQRIVQEMEPGSRVAVVVDDMSGATPKGNQFKANLRGHHRQLCKTGSKLQSGLDFSCLHPVIRFVNSSVSHQVQVADVAAYNVYRQFIEHGEEWEDISKLEEKDGRFSLPMYEWFEKIGGKFRKGPENRVQGYGIVKFPMVKRLPWKVVE
jgi:hypothetical protein